MKKIQCTYENTLIINKSRFIATIFRVNDVDEVNIILKDINKKYYDANHNCYAYVIGQRQEIQKCSDDNEPAKTAGFPILDVLLKQNATNILCVVTRYFGGILLGAGGLIRAYSNSCSEALKTAIFYETKEMIKYSVKVNYSTYNTILNYLNTYTIIDTIYDADVCVYVAVDKENEEIFKKDIINLTSDTALLTYKETFNIEVKCD